MVPHGSHPPWQGKPFQHIRIISLPWLLTKQVVREDSQMRQQARVRDEADPFARLHPGRRLFMPSLTPEAADGSAGWSDTDERACSRISQCTRGINEEVGAMLWLYKSWCGTLLVPESSFATGDVPCPQPCRSDTHDGTTNPSSEA